MYDHLLQDLGLNELQNFPIDMQIVCIQNFQLCLNLEELLMNQKFKLHKLKLRQN